MIEDKIDQASLLGDILKPVFTLNGKFKGMTIRPNLVDSKSMAKAVKACIYINRLLRDGLEESFKLQKNVKPKDGEKTFAQADVQVDVEELKANTSESEEEDFDKTIFNLVKEHAIDVYTRMKPTKKGY